jgi:hypothetical protein
VSFVFFFFSKQAFANYYYFTLGALCCSVAFASPEARGAGGDAQP